MAFHKSLLPYILPIPDDIQMHDQWIGVINDWHRGGTVFLKEPLLYYGSKLLWNAIQHPIYLFFHKLRHTPAPDPRYAKKDG